MNRKLLLILTPIFIPASILPPYFQGNLYLPQLDPFPRSTKQTTDFQAGEMQDSTLKPPIMCGNSISNHNHFLSLIWRFSPTPSISMPHFIRYWVTTTSGLPISFAMSLNRSTPSPSTVTNHLHDICIPRNDYL